MQDYLPDNCERCGARLAYLANNNGPAEVICGSCRHPVPPDHPLQIEENQAWKAQQEKERVEAEAKKKRPPTADNTPLLAREDAFLVMQARIEQQGKQIADILERMAKLTETIASNLSKRK